MLVIPHLGVDRNVPATVGQDAMSFLLLDLLYLSHTLERRAFFFLPPAEKHFLIQMFRGVRRDPQNSRGEEGLCFVNGTLLGF